MGVIFERELKALFRNIKAVLCIAAMTFISALFFVINDLSAGYSGMQSVLPNMSLVAALLIPPVAVFAISRERVKGTDAMLDALPLTVGGIIFGKLLAYLVFFGIPTAIMAVYSTVLAAVGGAPASQGYLMLLAFFAFEAFVTSLCFMISALVKKGWKALLICYGVLMGSFVIGALSALFNGFMESALEFFSPFRRFDPAVFDLFDISSIFFYLSLSALFVYISYVCYNRGSGREVNSVWGNRKVIATIMSAIVLLNVATYIFPSSVRQLDISADGVYSVSEQSKSYLSSLDDEITVYLIDPISSEEKLHAFIQRYCQLSDGITLQEVYTSKNPEFLTKYGLTSAPTYYSMIVESKNTGRWKLVSTDEYFKYYNSTLQYMTPSEYEEAVTYYSQMYEYYYQNQIGNEDTLETLQGLLYSLSYQTSLCIDAEEAIGTAIEYVTADKVPTLYFVGGHGEKDISANPLDISKKGAIPADAALIVINDPDEDYTAKEIALLCEYSEKGGRLIVITDSSVNDKPNLVRLLECFGLRAEDGEVSAEANVDLSSEAFETLPFEKINIIGGSSIVTVENDDLKFSKLLTTTVGEGEEKVEKTLAVSVSEKGEKKLIWLTGADTFNRDTKGMTDAEKTEYAKAAYCVQGSVSWLWRSFTASTKFPNPNEYEPAMLVVESGTATFIGVLFIGVLPVTMVGGAWLNLYVRKKRSRAPKEAE